MVIAMLKKRKEALLPRLKPWVSEPEIYHEIDPLMKIIQLIIKDLSLN